MAASTKILTVSYGTFSCTAEGFDDPLGAVRDTTQFFRGVVKEDRFFGAEPPKYDPALAGDMLRQQIAAEVEDGRMTLRPSTALPATAGWTEAEEPQENAVASDADDTGAETPDITETPDAVAPLLEAEAAPMQAPRPAAGLAAAASIADKLARIRAVVADTAVHDAAPQIAEAAPGTESTLPAAAVEDLNAYRGSLTDATDAYAGWVDDEDDADDDWDDDLEADDLEADAAVEDAVIGWGEDADEADAPVGWDDADDEEDHTELVAEAIEDDEDDAEPVAEFVEDNDDLDEDYDDQDAAYGDVDEADMAYDDEDDAEDDYEDVAAYAEEDAYAETETAYDDDEDAEGDDPFAPMLDELERADAAPAPAPRRRLAPPRADEQDQPRRRTRVISVKRAALDADVLAGDARIGRHSDRLTSNSSLEPEDEAALSAELAAIRDHEDTLDTGTAAATPFRLDNPIVEDSGYADDEDYEDDVDLQGVRKAVKMSNPGRAMLTEGAVGEDDESRLLEQANSELDEPEGSRRRNAFAHLRAAVAATRADLSLGRKASEDEETGPYRADLASVVRPRRPKGVAARAMRPTAAEQPSTEGTLQLVPSDSAPQAPREAVRPRRVSRTGDSAASRVPDAGGFAAYAAEVGAHALPDLLEAAAAYMAFVEGREQFSRPQLMSVVQRADGGQATREERLRSFGRLLRDGKIEKTRGGRFAATKTIGFRPSARAVG